MFHPSPLLFYVPNLCFIRGPMATLFQVIMTRYQMKLQAVWKWCQSAEWSVEDYNRLFTRICAVLHYRRLCLLAHIPEDVEKCSESLVTAEEDLHSFMHARCFPDSIKSSVWWLCSHVS